MQTAFFNKSFLRNRKNFLIIFVVILLVGGIYYFFFVSTPKTIRFLGSLVKVEGNTVTARGFYVFRNGDSSPRAGKEAQEINFQVGDNTKMWKRMIYFPSPNTTSGNVIVFNISDLPNQEGPGTLLDLQKSQDLGQVYIESEFPFSILGVLGLTTPKSESVIYQVEIRNPRSLNDGINN